MARVLRGRVSQATGRCGAEQLHPRGLRQQHGPSESPSAGMQVAWMYTVGCSTLLGFLVGATQIVLGTPGDLPETVKNIHEKGFVPPEQAPSMFVASAFSIAAGALDPLAAVRPLLAAPGQLMCTANLPRQDRACTSRA